MNLVKGVGVGLTACVAAAAVIGCGGSDSGSGDADEAFAKLKPGEASIYCVGECKKALRLTQKVGDKQK